MGASGPTDRGLRAGIGRAGRFAFVSAACLLCAIPARAQTPDTTATPADTLAVPADTLSQPPDSVAAPPPRRPLLGFDGGAYGQVVGDTLPAVTPALDAADVLAAVPGAFRYGFGTAGWPDGWSPFGLAPHRPSLWLDGVPFGDPVTGRPAYEALPLAYLEPLRLGATRLGGPTAVAAQMRDFPAPRPLTVFRYREGGGRGVAVAHAQERLRTFFGAGQPGRLGVAVGYAGRGADVYALTTAGGRGRRSPVWERQTWARLRYTHVRYAVELRNLHTRREVSAHGGVEPAGGLPFRAVYFPLQATVEDASNQRRTVRNDLALLARLATQPGPLTLRLYRTRHRLQFNAADTLAARVHRLGGAGHLRIGGLHLDAQAWRDRLGDGPALPDSLGLARTHLYATAADTLRVGGFALAAEAGYASQPGGSGPKGALSLMRRRGRLRPFVEATASPQPASWVAAYGFGGRAIAVPEVPGGRLAQARLGVEASAGAFDGLAFAFAARITDALDYAVDASGDTLRAVVAASPVVRTGATGRLAFREDAARGVYGWAEVTAIRLLDAAASDLHRRLDGALPRLHGQARLGARYVLFRGDLDLDAYVRARGWTEMRSRTLHPPTALLALPPVTARIFGPSGVLDIVAEAGIRGATVFLSYENALSGTVLQAGTLVVPVYPLPAQRLRFGVYWPIEG